MPTGLVHLSLSADPRAADLCRSPRTAAASPRQRAFGDAILTRLLHYDLPTERIAQAPCQPRDASRLMVLNRASGEIIHRTFRDLPDFLQPADCLVLNTSRVLPARFTARRETGGRLDGLFVRAAAPDRWTVLLAGAARLRPGESLQLVGCDTRLVLVARGERGLCETTIDPPAPPEQILRQVGRAPLPPYIRRTRASADGRDAADRDDYQTIYARQPGSVAAPTAGLHFTPPLLERIRDMGVGMAEVILHVGLGTFAPVESEDLNQHKMHEEAFELSESAAAVINRARSAGGRIVAVGSTSVRVLETVAAAGPGLVGSHGPPAAPSLPAAQSIRSMTGTTNILIQPPWEFRAVDALVTNFHLPGSTLLALVAAFAGLERTLHAYQTAVEQEYRFYSYGDAMLII